jgi:proline iminopeptidase
MSVIEKRLTPANGVMIETVIKGLGDFMVCITHPIGYWNDEDPPMEKWLEHFVWVTQRGRGTSSPYETRGDLAFSQFVDDIDAVRQALGIRRWVFMGFSSGGAIGLLYALKYPQVISGLIMSGTAPNYPQLSQDPRCFFSPNHPEWQNAMAEAAPMIQSIVSQSQKQYEWLELGPNAALCLKDGHPQNVVPWPGEVSCLDQVFWEETFKVDVLDQLAAIHTPTLIMNGRKDPIVPVDYAELLHQGIRGSELIIFENSEHGPSEADFSDYQAAVKRFLENTRE